MLLSYILSAAFVLVSNVKGDSVKSCDFTETFSFSMSVLLS